MRGSDDGLEAGVTPLAIHDIFARVEELEGVREFLIRVSYMELYNEEIYDLLNQDEGGSNGKLQVHESAERGIYVAGLHEEVVTRFVMWIILFIDAFRQICLLTGCNYYDSLYWIFVVA